LERQSAVREADTEEERTHDVDPTTIREAIGEASVVDLLAVSEVTTVQAWRRAVEEQSHGLWGNDSSQG
jgi:hypothetical protein